MDVEAIANTAPDLPPAPGARGSFARDHEYQCHGYRLGTSYTAPLPM
jgi:hypothetical protein